MKKLIWTTDPHLNFPPSARVESFFKSIEKEKPNFVLIGGDIGDSKDIVKHLKRFAEIESQILFVLGNHSYYHSSFQRVQHKIRKLVKQTDNLIWLDESKPIKVTSSCGIIGDGCWADGRSGNWEQSDVGLNDFKLITDFALYPRNDNLRLMQKIADKSAKNILKNLKLAFKKYDHVYLLTHVPPWREASVCNGKVSDDNWAPFFVCTVVGEAIETFMKTCKGKLTVLCGHTHGKNELDISDNIHVSTGRAIYYEPEINKIFFEKDTVKKLF